MVKNKNKIVIQRYNEFNKKKLKNLFNKKMIKQRINFNCIIHFLNNRLSASHLKNQIRIKQKSNYKHQLII